ncbi:MAG: SDR family NAD(P)-dependent oxidoreductase [Candidatus Cryptobacteroides sp.]
MKKKDFAQYRTYALVTGAASGMGRLYALKLARRGYSLLLVDINAERLDATAEEIRAEVASFDDFRKEWTPSFDLVTIPQDLSAQDAASKVAAAAKGRTVEVLINNAGIMYCKKTCETSPKFLSLMMMLHCHTPLMLCREFVPAMIERGNGYVLNISSLAAWMEWPAIGMYGNTKRFVKGFSRSLRIECRGTGVSVSNAYFGAVDTPLVPLKPNLRKLARNLQVMIDADKATDKALNAMFKRRKGTMPGFVNKIFFPFVVILPDCLLGWALNKFGKYLYTKNC